MRNVLYEFDEAGNSKTSLGKNEAKFINYTNKPQRVKFLCEYVNEKKRENTISSNFFAREECSENWY